jgi:RimJ/RimL family protein N-acetyltransferase
MTGEGLTRLHHLRIRTPRLVLRLPTEPELHELAGVAERGVHDAHLMPFVIPWTDGIGSPSFVEDFVGYHLGLRSKWRPDEWGLELGVWADGMLMGVQGLHAKDYPRERSVDTGSWLGRAFQGRGYGTEMRAAILDLAFTGLGATRAESGALEGNIASERVSAKIGYRDAGERWQTVRGERVRERLFVLRREDWMHAVHPPAEIAGLDACLPLFGAAY